MIDDTIFNLLWHLRKVFPQVFLSKWTFLMCWNAVLLWLKQCGEATVLLMTCLQWWQYTKNLLIRPKTISTTVHVFFFYVVLKRTSAGKNGSATCHCSWPFSVVDYIFSSPILFSSRCRWRVSFFAMAWLVFLQFLRTGLSVQHLPSYPAACSRRQIQKTNHELERYTECTPSWCRCNSWRHLGKLWVSNLSLAVANMSLAKLTNLRSRNIAFGEP